MPFTVNQFLEVFARYNVAVWPAQVFFYALAILAIYLAIQRKAYLRRGISYILAAFWIWMGLVYHFWYFSTLNRVALIFATFFVLQGALLFIAGTSKQELTFGFAFDLYGVVGSILLLYALIIYPALGYWFGHRYPATPTFGLPCPTTIFTFGILLWTDRRVPLYLLAIPLVWSLIGVWAAISLGMREDYGLLAAGVIASGLIVWQDTNKRRHARTDTLSAGQLFHGWRS